MNATMVFIYLTMHEPQLKNLPDLDQMDMSAVVSKPGPAIDSMPYLFCHPSHLALQSVDLILQGIALALELSVSCQQ